MNNYILLPNENYSAIAYSNMYSRKSFVFVGIFGESKIIFKFSTNIVSDFE